MPNIHVYRIHIFNAIRCFKKCPESDIYCPIPDTLINRRLDKLTESSHKTSDGLINIPDFSYLCNSVILFSMTQ
jgi:hypothetical protein